MLIAIALLGALLLPGGKPSVAPRSIAKLAAGASTAPGGSLARGYVGATAPEPIVIQEDHHDTSPPLSYLASIPAYPADTTRRRELEVPREQAPGGTVLDPARQPYRADAGGALMPAPVVNVAGLNSAACGGCFPPDTEGDVGPNHYFQWVNTSFTILNKSGGVVTPLTPGNAIWTGFGGLCETTNNGDPIVLYDRAAGRWMVSQFAFNGVDPSGNAKPPFMQCIAVSQTSDPTGAYYRYGFVMSNTKFNDYPHFGVWPDGYYMSINQFGDYPNQSFVGWGAAVFERDKMLLGLSAQMVVFNTGQNFVPIATDLDGATAPPAGSPGLFFDWSNATTLARWKLSVNWVTPGSSSLTGPTSIAVASSDHTSTDAPQPGTAVKLDGLMDRMMYRNAYRNFGTHESVVLNHTARISATQLGIRWYELRDPEGTPLVNQQSTYTGDTNDGHSRWMGSVAMDRLGDMALGYSISSSTKSPSVRYVGRLVGDPLSTMPQGEVELVAGAGAQTGTFASNLGRWGDYSMMGIDPTDDCTFWYTQEYTEVVAPTSWRTRVGSFRFPNCSAPTGVSVASFAAVRGRRGVTLTWRSDTETRLAGFNIVRDGKKLNRTLIAAKRSGRVAGATYGYVDLTAKAGRKYMYRLQLVDLSGKRTFAAAGGVAAK